MRKEETSGHFPPKHQPNSSGPRAVSNRGRHARSRQKRKPDQWTPFYTGDHAATLPKARRYTCTHKEPENFNVQKLLLFRIWKKRKAYFMTYSYNSNSLVLYDSLQIKMAIKIKWNINHWKENWHEESLHYSKSQQISVCAQGCWVGD